MIRASPSKKEASPGVSMAAAAKAAKAAKAAAAKAAAERAVKQLCRAPSLLSESRGPVVSAD